MSISAGIFDRSDLVKCYAPPNLLSVMPGNKVMLRSGGPRMTVCDVLQSGDAVCQWEGEASRLEQSVFALACLTCYGAE